MNDSLIHLIFVAQIGSCLFVTGLIWFVQIVHYPLLAHVGKTEFENYERRHTRLTTWVVGPPMLIEALTSLFLVWYPPAVARADAIWTGIAALLVVWISTAILQIPCHDALIKGFDSKIHRRLVFTNWLRTFCWSLRAVILLGIVWQMIENSTATGNANMATLSVGEAAPNFSAQTYEGKSVSLSDYIGKRGLVLFFYPKDGTSVCTAEACAFRDSYEKFAAAGFDVIGVSADSDQSHQKFATEHKLSFPLISDSDGKLRKQFGVQATFGIIPGRVTFVIDKTGIIRLVYSALLASDDHVTQALNVVSGGSTN